MNDVALFDFSDFIGQEFDFYGVDGQRFRLDDTTYEIIEDENGCSDIVISDVRIEGLPIARVVVENVAFGDDCCELHDLHDDHCWLEFGTTYEEVASDGNARFVFEYSPKGPAD
jgi:hypothetical protein